MSDTHRYGNAALILAVFAGAAVGAVAALLTAPRSGRETRERLGAMARDATDRAAHMKPALGRATVRAAQAARDAFTRTFDEEMGPPIEPTAGEH